MTKKQEKDGRGKSAGTKDSLEQYQWAKGESGNPSGRPRGLASYVRETTDGGREMVDLMVQVMRGETINGMKPKIRDMTDTAGWLTNR